MRSRADLPHAQQSVQSGKADLAIDVDMTAKRRRAEGDHLPNEPLGSFFDAIAQFASQFLFARDAFGDGVARSVGLKWQAKERLVEVDMPIDEARHQKRAAEIDRVRVRFYRRAICLDRRDPPAGDADVGATAVE